MVLLCYRKHSLVKVAAPDSRTVSCDVCNSTVMTGHSIFRCDTCDWDSCESCFEKRSAEDTVSYDGVVELMRMTEAARRIDMQSKGWKVPDLQAMCRILGQPEKGLKAELISRIAMCEGVSEVLTRDERYRSPVGTRSAATLRASALVDVPNLPGPSEPGSNSASSTVAAGSSVQEQQQPTVPVTTAAAAAAAVAAHAQVELHRAQAASLMPPVFSLGQPSSLPLQPPPGVGAAVPPPGSPPSPMPSADMLVDPHEPQQPTAAQRPKAPLAPRPSTLSPVVARHKEQFQEFIARRQVTLPPI